MTDESSSHWKIEKNRLKFYDKDLCLNFYVCQMIEKIPRHFFIFQSIVHICMHVSIRTDSLCYLMDQNEHCLLLVLRSYVRVDLLPILVSSFFSPDLIDLWLYTVFICPSG